MKPNLPKHVFLAAGLAGLLLQACGGGGGGGDSVPTPASFTLSGVVRPVAGTAADRDVNDPNAAYSPNDSVDTAQPMPNPVVLGGYVNQPGSGPAGRSGAVGDVRDMYRASLLAGQQINLLIAGDGASNDLDLGLADLNGNLLDVSASQQRVESLAVPSSGDYLVVVTAVRGASNYVLTAGYSLGTTTANGMRLSDSFVPGEVIVKFRDAAAIQGDGLRARARTLGLTDGERAGVERDRLIDKDYFSKLGISPARVEESASGFAGLSISEAQQAKLETILAVKKLNRDPDVESAGLNLLRKPCFVPNDPLYPFQWHYPQLNLPQAWDLTTGADAIVAVIDTGVVFSHPDLQGQFVDGYDFISSLTSAGDGDGIDPDPSDPGDLANGDGSSSFHGTHVTGTVAAATNNAVGVAGVAFNAKIMPLRVCGRPLRQNEGGCSTYDIVEAMRFAAGLPNDSGTVPARRADVINFSLGGNLSSSAEQAVIDQVRAAGVVVVAAAGNLEIGRQPYPVYPAAYPGVIGVSAVDINKAPAPYSNSGSWVSVAAPGGNMSQDVNGDGKRDGITSTSASDVGGNLVNGYETWEGTSVATPHVAGVVALMKAAAPNLTPQDIANLLASGALTDDLGTPGKDDQFGYGLINANKAVAAAGANPPDPTPILSVSPAALNFGINLNSQTLMVLNSGTGTLTVNPPTVDAGGWLSVAPIQVDASGLGVYTVSVNRAGLADGVYSANLTFTSNAGTFQVRVAMQVANNPSAGSVGQQYVLLVRPNSGETVADVTAQLQADGGYAFTVRNVPAGTYQLFAGSDSNNDGGICDAGEACGAYPTLGQPATITVDRDLSGLDFVSGFTISSTGLQRGGSVKRYGSTR